MAPKTATRKRSTAGASTRPRSAARRSTGAGADAPRFHSRAVLRLIEAGSGVECAHCGEQVKFKARERLEQAICNVYVGRRWDRVEHYHAPCYLDAGEPYGEAEPAKPRVAGSRPANKVARPAD